MNLRFQTKRLVVRDIEKGDLKSLLKICTEEKNMKYVSNGNHDWTLAQLSEKYKILNQNYINGFGVFVIEDKFTREIIGEAGLFKSYGSHSKLELGYIINFQHWKKGYGFEICNGLINYGFRELKTEIITARMYSENKASVRLSEKCGMHKINDGLTEKGEKFFEYEISNRIE
ncbi:N-acetyltransferase [Brumimicrobium glaciale]|uniref:N-acetyltransferase n=1 Tax=Brumimicrobium glaciale TaxID=200475 RepID=A0A4Q4KG38_9FLAO|nr:GNAT family N-acetyltransferase [Brumimicrobium glaciale]RYM32091.1 N-acetyltransferase [Brumimicrobium glaciale]